MKNLITLKPNVTREAAIRQLQPRRFFGLRLQHPLRAVADVYVPFRLFRVEIQNGVQKQLQWLALDGVQGTFDLYSFDSMLQSPEIISIETRNHPLPTLELHRATEILLEKVQRLVFGRGFFRMKDLKIRAECLPLDLHVPYWVGFYGSPEKMELVVMDAVRRRLEGAKVRNFFRDWLAENWRSEKEVEPPGVCNPPP